MFVRDSSSTLFEFENRTVLVCGGAGRSGHAAARLLLTAGASVVISDSNPDRIDYDGLLNFTKNKRIEVVEEQDPEHMLSAYSPDVIVTAPGVPLSLPLFQLARSRSIPVFGELDLAAGFIQTHSDAFLIAVTGTDGKTTTVSLLTQMLSDSLLTESGSVKVTACGNIGLPVSDVALELINGNKADILVLECSSFQLEPVHFFHPKEAAILNLAEDHLNRYDSMKDYALAKLNIAKNQTEDDSFYINSEFYLRNFKSETGFDFRPRTEKISAENLPIGADINGNVYDCSRFALPGRHNRMNLEFCVRILKSVSQRLNAQIHFSKLQQCLDTFQGLPHRLETVTEKENILFVNDSKATTVQSMLVALASFAGREIYLLLGGLDKESDFTVLNDCISADRLFAYGKAAQKISSQTGCSRFENLEEAFRTALKSAQTNTNTKKVILLSPACASQDQYKDYQERGEHFKKLCFD